MGVVVFAAFTPHVDKEGELLAVIAERLPMLRRLGMATDRPNITVRTADGTIIDVSEWTDHDSIERAHTNPEVIALWARFEACAEFRPLEGLDELTEMFAGFEAVDV